MCTVLFVMCLLCLATQAQAFTYWNQVRNSAALPNGQLAVRVENPSGAGIQNSLLFGSPAVEEVSMLSIPDGPSTNEGFAPGPTGQRRYYGFRLQQGETIDLVPVQLPTGADPAPGELTRVAADAVGDQLFGLVNLDLVDCRVSFSGSSFYTALVNAGGGFPVNSGLTFYSYLLGIADPNQTDPDTVFAILYTYNQPGVISPGLYKVTGTGLGDLEKIGEITVDTYPSQNALVLSCLLEDLLADPDFASWYDPTDPCVAVAGFTQKITLLGGTQESDRTTGGDCYLREFPIDPGTNHLPNLANLEIVGTGASAFAQVTYTDADGHCPVQSELRLVYRNLMTYAMRPQSLDYGSTVIYATERGIAPLASGEWCSATARFSDNATNVIELRINGPAASVADGTSGIETVRVCPNPFKMEAEFVVHASTAEQGCLRIVDPLGRTVRVFPLSARVVGAPSIVWDGQDTRGRDVPGGIYFWSLETVRGMAKGTVIRLQ
jgi:hypothetical protein